MIMSFSSLLFLGYLLSQLFPSLPLVLQDLVVPVYSKRQQYIVDREVLYVV